MKRTGKQFYYEEEKQKKNDSSNDKKNGRIVFFHSYLLRNRGTKAGKNRKEVVRELCFNDDLFFGAGMQKFQLAGMKTLAFHAFVGTSGAIEAISK